MSNYNLAIVEDDAEMLKMLKNVLNDYFVTKKEQYSLNSFSSAEDFLNSETELLDIIFIDIELPGINGMEAIKKIRETNPSVMVIFVTYLTQFAIEGYSVNAFDYILKPFIKDHVFNTLNRALNKLNKNTEYISVGNSNRSIKKKIAIDSIKFIESENHRLIFHLTNGVIKINGSIKKIAEELKNHSFFLCSVSYLVNLKYITTIKGNEVTLGEETVYISRSKKKDFLQAVNEYVGKGG